MFLYLCLIVNIFTGYFSCSPLDFYKLTVHSYLLVLTLLLQAFLLGLFVFPLTDVLVAFPQGYLLIRPAFLLLFFGQ